jgi:hypothetical protein
LVAQDLALMMQTEEQAAVVALVKGEMLIHRALVVTELSPLLLELLSQEQVAVVETAIALLLAREVKAVVETVQQ